jgi:hypothetical protein
MIVTALGNDHMVRLGKLSKAIGCVSMVLAVPMFAIANGSAHPIEATHFASSGRTVNVVADMTAADRADARAQVWALTGHQTVPTCETPCYGAFQTNSRSAH